MAAAAAAALMLAACGPKPPLRVMACAAAPPVAVAASADGRERTATLSVLTYNLEGLGWPARKGRARELRAIGAQLAAMHAAGTAPDVVLFQEMFSGAAKHAVAASGYPAIVPGPRRTTRPMISANERMPGKSKPLKGEIGIRLLGGGLAVASRYPIVETRVNAYGLRSCAGFDCLANKGIMLARIALPGVPVPVDIYNSHMNSRHASRVSEARNREAHARQAVQASRFIAATENMAHPLIFGGDFNMRHSEARWEEFSEYHPLMLVHEMCIDRTSGCEVKMSWDGDAPWMDTQDLQFFANGERMEVRPIRVEAMFDGGASGPRLSDHDGFLVTYELRWPAGAEGTGACSG
ncbi:endonuclease/exonuclease/phosphatase family metal-dependent hydrolase [Sphingopyxis panaciterrae]|uniref:endonuclease/exonuclease/phosphatase family protein n=1 Tax=Sphingopyxis panaciterrae TaxID=363841 RepID=UPI001FB92ACC|nr:endonuclease/exonuclease/phosphatase family protein [Sphingopyxis panaciterrae]NIJ39338.1 endonuclease/exonuclease/phosphatase family metal-dependent hydrolase [Sphingopyxis panaciterrae]